MIKPVENLMKHPEIPEGIYCYTYKRGPFEICPYWSIDPNHEDQNNGYCSFLRRGDWMIEGGLLWDQCKECGVNEDVNLNASS